MSDNIKLVIEIPKYVYEEVKTEVAEGIFDYNGTNATIFKAVSNGKPSSENTGEWITDETSGSALNDRYYCSNCGKELKMPYAVIKAEQKNGKYLFCDRCGSDMRGKAE